MSRVIQCPSCEKTLKLGESTAQKSIIDCPVCAQKIRINRDSAPSKENAQVIPERRQTSAPQSRSRSTAETRPQKTERASRKRDSETRPARASQPTYGSPPPRRSNKETLTRPERGRNRSASNNSGFSIAMMTAGIIFSFLAAIGAIWWVASHLGGDSVVQESQLVAETSSDESNPDSLKDMVRASGAKDLANSPVERSMETTPSSLPDTLMGSIGNQTENSPVSGEPAVADRTSQSNPSDKFTPDATPPSFSEPSVAPPSHASPATAPPASVAGSSRDNLHYGLSHGDTHVYSFELDAEVEGQTLSFPGSVSLSVSSGRAAGLDDAIHGTGTGFVVTANGYLVTCHHVIEDAMVIEVLLNGKTYPGRVIASDKKQDLAIVKIEANGLPFVSLADSDQALLAEDVRAIGYPLTDLLGQGLKVTRGTLSGINEDPERRRFQVDAAINPGNSGGPLFNERGQVIGVNSAKLYADDTVSTVGFAVPSNYTKQLLQQNQIAFDARDGGPALSGPVLVQNVRTAVALLKVEKRKHLNEQFVLNYTGRYNNPLASGEVRFPGVSNGQSGFTSAISSSGKVIVDEFGEIEDVEDADQLPFYAGNMATLMIHPLDPEGERSWTREIPFLLVKAQKSGPSYDSPGARFGGRFGGHSEQIPDEVLTGGIETHRYRIIESNDREIKISRTYELRTLDHPTLPLATIQGKGTIIFDRRDMMPSSMEFRQTYEIRKDGQTLRIPMRIAYLKQNGTSRNSGFAARERNAAAERAASRKERIRQAGLKAAEKLAQKEAERKARAARVSSMSQEERLNFYLDEIKSKRGHTIYAELTTMAVMESRRADVCNALESCLTSRRLDEAQLMALAHWATPQVISVMIRKLETLEPYNWTGGTRLLAALASTKQEQVIAPIIKVLASNQTALNDAARRALGVLGTMAEDSLIAEMERAATSIGVKTLGDIGTQKSIPVLEQIAKASGPWLRRYSNDSIAKIQRRFR